MENKQNNLPVGEKKTKSGKNWKAVAKLVKTYNHTVKYNYYAS
jgi:hypothetical protein